MLRGINAHLRRIEDQLLFFADLYNDMDGMEAIVVSRDDNSFNTFAVDRSGDVPRFCPIGCGGKEPWNDMARVAIGRYAAINFRVLNGAICPVRMVFQAFGGKTIEFSRGKLRELLEYAIGDDTAECAGTSCGPMISKQYAV